MRPHEKLEVWKKSVSFVTEVYKTTENFPADERFGLTSQIRRAAVSVPSNIAEGAARNSNKEFLYFLSNAQGSVSELATEILIALNLGMIDNAVFAELDKKLAEVGRMITGLRNHIRSNLK